MAPFNIPDLQRFLAAQQQQQQQQQQQLLMTASSSQNNNATGSNAMLAAAAAAAFGNNFAAAAMLAAAARDASAALASSRDARDQAQAPPTAPSPSGPAPGAAVNEAVLLMALNLCQQQQQQQQQNQQQHQQNQHQKMIFNQWRNSAGGEINNNNEVDKSPQFLQQPYSHAPLQHSLSAVLLNNNNNNSFLNKSSKDASPPPASSDSKLLLTATTSDYNIGAGSVATNNIGNDDKPKRRSRLGGTSLKTAKVWRFFTQQPHPEQAATCQLCHKIIKATNSSTTGMIRHLRSCHPAEHKIVEDERHLTLMQKSLKTAATDAEKVKLLQMAHQGASPAMSSLLNSLNVTQRQTPTTPLTSFAPVYSNTAAADESSMLDVAATDNNTRPVFDNTMKNLYFRMLLNKSQNAETVGSCFDENKATLSQQLNNFLNNNDDSLVNNNNSNAEKNDSGLGEHNDSEEDDEEERGVPASMANSKTPATSAANISPKIGATAVTTPTKLTTATAGVKLDTAATAEEDAPDVDPAATTMTLTEEDSGLLHNDSTFSPAHDDEDEEEDRDEENGQVGEESAAAIGCGHANETTKDDGCDDDEPLVKPSPIFVGQRGVKRPIPSSTSTWMFDNTLLRSEFDEPWTQQKTRRLNDEIALMLVSDSAPVSMVECNGFRQLINVLCPNYQMPSAAEFERDIIPRLPMSLGCQLAGRVGFKENNPHLPAEDGSKQSPMDFSDSGFQDEDLENRSPELPTRQQLNAFSSVLRNTLSLQSQLAKKTRAHSPPTLPYVKVEMQEMSEDNANSDGINGESAAANVSTMSSSGFLSLGTDTNNNLGGINDMPVTN